MQIKINGVEIAEYPTEFTVTPLDVDNAETTNRAADATLHRDRIAEKRQIDMSFGLIEWPVMATLLQSMSNPYFEVYYPDPMEGNYVTKTFYVNNRPCQAAVEQKGKLYWKGLKFTLTER